MGGAAAGSMGPALSLARTLPRIPTALQQGMAMRRTTGVAEASRSASCILPCFSQCPIPCSSQALFRPYASQKRHFSLPYQAPSDLSRNSFLVGSNLFHSELSAPSASSPQKTLGGSIRAERPASSAALKTPSISAPSSKKQQLIDTNPPRGTRDFPPEEMRLRTWLFNHFREVSGHNPAPNAHKLGICSTQSAFAGWRLSLRRGLHWTNLGSFKECTWKVCRANDDGESTRCANLRWPLIRSLHPARGCFSEGLLQS
jgi:hypothetical protein